MLGGIAEALSGFLGRREHRDVLSSKSSIATSARLLEARHVDQRAGTESWRHRPASVRPEAEPAQPRRHTDRLEHHSPQEHAVLLLEWIQRNIDLNRGMIFREALQEYYAEAVSDAGWAARHWNPIAREFDLICTNGKKPYQWTADERGRMRRRRHYPIPALLTKVMPIGADVEWRAA